MDLSPNEMADLMTVVCVDETVLDSFVQGIDDISNHGAAWLVENRPDVAEACGVFPDALAADADEYSDKRPWHIPIFRQFFCRYVRRELVRKINLQDSLSQVASLVLTDESDGADDWPFDDNPLTAWAAQKGNNAVVRGEVKRGKTNFTLRLGEEFLAEGRTIIANIKVRKPPEKYIYCKRLSDMFIAICEARLRGERILLLFDEGQLYWHKTQTVQPKNLDLAKLVLCYGKTDTNMVYVGHYDKDIPTVVKVSAKADFRKTGQRSIIIKTTEGVRISSAFYTSVPATTLDYDPEEFQWFSLDMSIDALFEFLSEMPEEANQWEEIKKYVVRHRGDAADDQIGDKDVACYLRRKKGKSLNEIVDVLERPKGTVYAWIKDVAVLAE